nr:type II toxin-antitoxin system VapC family toxin [Polyangiaceae bacterium]
AAAAHEFAPIAAQRRAIGRPIAQFDAQIAAIARSRAAAVATRNTRDFEDCGILLSNPWKA